MDTCLKQTSTTIDAVEYTLVVRLICIKFQHIERNQRSLFTRTHEESAHRTPGGDYMAAGLESAMEAGENIVIAFLPSSCFASGSALLSARFSTTGKIRSPNTMHSRYLRCLSFSNQPRGRPFCGICMRLAF